MVYPALTVIIVSETKLYVYGSCLHLEGSE